jgi:hypothetical protein
MVQGVPWRVSRASKDFGRYLASSQKPTTAMSSHYHSLCPTVSTHCPEQSRVNTCFSTNRKDFQLHKQSSLLYHTPHNTHTSASTHPRQQPAATWVNTTRYCKYSQVLLMMAEKHRPKHVELTWNNKLNYIIILLVIYTTHPVLIIKLNADDRP